MSALLQDYLDLRAQGNWTGVCSYLAAKQREEQTQLAPGKKCAEAMTSFAVGASPTVLAEEAKIEVLSLRVAQRNGKRYAFLIYHRPDGIWATALGREGGRWRVISVTPNPIE